MKKNLFILGTWLVATFLILVSCNKEKEAEGNSPISEGCIPFELVACSADTKTTNDGLSTKWAEGDAVNVFHAVAGTTEYINDGAFTVSNTESGTFTGTLASALDASQSYDWYIYYPYNPDITSPENTSGGYSTVAAFTQSQTSNDSKDHLAGLPLAGKVTTDAGVSKPVVSMKQLAAVIKVVVTNNFGSDITVADVRFTSPVNMAGDYYVNFKDPDNPVYTEKSESVEPSVTLSTSVETKNGGSSTYYLIVKPFEASASSTITLKVNNYEKSVTLDADKTFSAGNIYPITFNYGNFPKQKKRVVCWGDSLTNLTETTYTAYLQSLLGDDWEVFNGGTSGDRTDEIAARQGGLPIVTGNAFTIPAGTKTITIDGILKTHTTLFNNELVNFRRFAGALRNPCRLVGTNGEEVLCNITSNRTIVGTDTTYTATLKRLTAGQPVDIAEHTPIETFAARELREIDLTIIYMGANGCFGSNRPDVRVLNNFGWENLIDQHWEMINFTSDPNSYLVLGQHWTRKWDDKGYSTAMEAAFGDHYINLRTPVVSNVVYWLLYSGAYAGEGEIPQADINRAAEGYWPSILLKDTQHPNEYGAKIMAKLVYDRMVELGYVGDDQRTDIEGFQLPAWGNGSEL